jgi:(E)-4-hydroxy-3-methylbut-2-enyl-diphosphate synthase
MIDLFNYHRRASSVVHVGAIDIGGDNPVRVQSMTTTDTNDTEACVAQAERIIKAGGELVRLTTQGVREAENLKNINAGVRSDGFSTPLVADVHFNPRVADVAACYAEKVRINPGNYVDPARKFIKLEYTDEEYARELKKIEDRFVPFLNICKENHTAIRIGVNHGSLSDRIRNRYGDTPEGIVESCMEFLRICKKENFSDVVISIKSSNTVVMVRSVRLLVEKMEEENMHYPLHLGVTEAGEGEDGRIKSAVGIGALLADGIGDTIRVSLSEEPEDEIPVARHLVDYIGRKAGQLVIPGKTYEGFDWLRPRRRPTKAVGNIGGENVPVVIMSASDDSCKKQKGQKPTADYIYTGSKLPENPKQGQKYIVDYQCYLQAVQSHSDADKGRGEASSSTYKENLSTHSESASVHGENPSVHGSPISTQEKELKENLFPIFPVTAMPFIGMVKADLKFLVVQFGTPTEEYIPCLKAHPEVVVICPSNHQNRLGEQRALVHEMMTAGVENPVVFAQMYKLNDKPEFQLRSAADMGALMMDGFTDGIWLMNEGNISFDEIEETAFGILQAARLRTTRTEYISCPGCGRTLYDLRETIAKIKEATKELKGLKIGIMGCIVNGPGEMADADYGYVGAGPKKVSLYRKQECVEHNIPEEEAVERLLKLIREDRKKGIR